MRVLSEAKSVSVLIVDDDPVFSALAEAVLLDTGRARVESSGACEEGLRRALSAQPPPDLVILDLNMPDFDGMAAMRLMNDLSYQGCVAIVSGEKPAVLQASASLARLHGLRLTGTLSKPLRPDELIAALPDQPAVAKAPWRAANAGAGPGKFKRLVPVYQPKVRLADKRIYGAEALMRVEMEGGRVTPPLDYLATLTDLGDFGDATLSFLAMVLADLRSWRGLRPQRPVSVNVPALLLEQPAFMEQFAADVCAADVSPSQITIEMTEAVLPNDMTKLVEVTTRMRMAGFGLAIDDYGTGMANYDVLRLCPFTELKIDRSVAQAAEHDPLACSFIGNCVSIGRELSMTVVAEGVEISAQAEAMKRLGVDVIQGYFFSKPLTAAQYMAKLGVSTQGENVRRHLKF